MMKNILFASLVCLAVLRIGEVIGWHLGHRDGYQEGYSAAVATINAMTAVNNTNLLMQSLKR